MLPTDAQTRLLQADSATRKTFPMATGLLDYFPDALAYVAWVSYMGNQKHNPGEPLHHARGKSMDHADCIIRHVARRGEFDGEIRESGSTAWRALALLQEELEQAYGLPLPRGASGERSEVPPVDAPPAFAIGEIIQMQPGETLTDTVARIRQERAAPETKFGFTVGEKVNLLYYGDELNPGTVMGFRDDGICISWQAHPRTDMSDCASWNPEALRHGA